MVEDLDKARMARLQQQMQAAGWNPDAGSLASNPVKIWLYSVSFHSGTRMVAQVGAQLYRDMLSGDGLIKSLIADVPNPVDALSSALHVYDGLGSPGSCERQMLTACLALYAQSTRTWEMIKPLNEVEGAHFFVFDWIARDGKTRVLRPAHHHQKGPMNETDIVGFFSYVMDAHLQRHPNDAPR
ncbi:hypothetical protein HG264_14215 [Pseudomonas sp. gcc21]|uniref:hypothetical protein n=1 Tax=Pseudomonas sp. gcc21 TaxID=2726989 RepID=UPI0014518408|nr:hypothetical protein [Pseudomonas sp. gcc21]QJD59969.1 hypothetical protein HG264_14215 [Pseudomonas sp. gcc21]